MKSILIFFSAILVSNAIDLVKEHVDTYKTYLDALKPDSKSSFDFKKIYELHDADHKCTQNCETFLNSITETPDWGFFEKLLKTLYDGQISEDPFYPQEIHLGLTSRFDSMKVMW